MHIRLATDKDMKAIWEIWMQDHVIKYMSFEKMAFSEFQPLFHSMAETSQIYVLVEQEAGEEKVIAVRRLEFGKEECSHVVGMYSLGLHKDYLKKGYGHKFYEQLLELIKKNKSIKRVELTQSEGNEAAFHLAEKYGFEVEVIFPNWLLEKLYERYVALILDKEILKDIANADLDFIPSNVIHKYTGNPVPVSYELIRGSSVLKHIGFLSIKLDDSVDLNRAADFMQDLGEELFNQGIKKIEVFTHESKIIKLLEILGYQYRGKKIAALRIGEKYFNEIGADLDLTVERSY
jgi:L-amino acid N-acyltransferase YncA